MTYSEMNKYSNVQGHNLFLSKVKGGKIFEKNKLPIDLISAAEQSKIIELFNNF